MKLELTENFIAQCSHVGWGFLLAISPALIFHTSVWWFASIVCFLSGIKEYWDSHGLESEILAGNSWEDWAYWNLGVLWALAVTYLAG
jgi:hypothetical protein